MVPSLAPLRMPRLKPKAAKRLKLVGVLFFGAVMASVAVIAPTQTQPRMNVVSGQARTKTTSTGASEKWPANKPVTIVLDGSLDELGPNARTAVRNAFGTWVASGVGVPALTIDNQKASGHAARDGVNRILVGPINLAGHEKDVAATIAYADERTGAIVEVDMIFNSKYAFAVVGADGTSDDTKSGSDDSTTTSQCKKDYDLQNIATHEAGHFFGLGEDMDDDQATMYFRSATCEITKRELTAPDREAMATLYPMRTSGTEDMNGSVPGSGDSSTDGVKSGGCGARIAPVTSSRNDAAFALLAIALAAAARRLRIRARGPLQVAPARLRAVRSPLRRR
jgi:MYXO-CTERM domain-containing protein